MRAATRGSAAALLLLISVALPLSSRAAERALPPIVTYDYSAHHSGVQQFAAATAANGTLAFGNLSGLLTYDGAWWSTIQLPNESAVYSVATDEAGRIFVGGVSEFGVVQDGVYRSLVNAVPESARNFGDVTGVVRCAGATYLLSDRFLFRTDGTAVAVVRTFDTTEGRRLHASNGAVYVTGEGKPELVGGAGPQIDVDGVELIAPTSGNASLVIDRRHAIYLVDANGARLLDAEGTKKLGAKPIQASVPLANGAVAIATAEPRLIVVERDASVDRSIDAASGLPEQKIVGLTVDRDGAVWSASEYALTRVELNAPVSVFDRRVGLRGGVQHIVRFRGRLYFCTSEGLAAADLTGVVPRVNALPQMPMRTWHGLVVDDTLLIATSDGVYSTRDGETFVPVPGTEHATTYSLLRSKTVDGIWMGRRDGLALLQRRGDTWAMAQRVSGAPRYVRECVETAGQLSCGTTFDGALRLDLSTTPWKLTLHGRGETSVSVVDQQALYSTQEDVFTVDRAGVMQHNAALAKLMRASFGWQLEQDRRGNVWFDHVPPMAAMRQPDGSFTTRTLGSVSGARVMRIIADDDGVLWLCTEARVYRLDADARVGDVSLPRPLIRRAQSGERPVDIRQSTTLPFEKNRVRVEFSPLTYATDVTYQHRLEPLDDKWSEWNGNAFVEYTALPDGEYTLHVRSRSSGAESAEAQWHFVIAPPWWRTRTAVAAWTLLLALFVFIVVKIRTRSLRRKASQLTAQVTAQTERLNHTISELTRTQADLAEKNELLQRANSQLENLALFDELTGIGNRRLFDRALSDEWKRATRSQQSLALIMLDLDHFKELNDTSGHPAGDAALVRIGAFLRERIRRSGELAVRYGGEEFAVLLPGASIVQAATIATALREGIEALALQHPTYRSLTASVGVTACVPALGESAQRLVDEADHALYAAKQSGRNRVVVHVPPSAEPRLPISETPTAG